MQNSAQWANKPAQLPPWAAPPPSPWTAEQAAETWEAHTNRYLGDARSPQVTKFLRSVVDGTGDCRVWPPCIPVDPTLFPAHARGWVKWAHEKHGRMLLVRMHGMARPETGQPPVVSLAMQTLSGEMFSVKGLRSDVPVANCVFMRDQFDRAPFVIVAETLFDLWAVHELTRVVEYVEWETYRKVYWHRAPVLVMRHNLRRWGPTLGTRRHGKVIFVPSTEPASLIAHTLAAADCARAGTQSAVFSWSKFLDRLTRKVWGEPTRISQVAAALGSNACRDAFARAASLVSA